MESISYLLARVFMVVIFLGSGVNKVTGFDGTIKYMESAGMSMPQLLLPGAIVVLLLGGLSVLLGFKARFGAIGLIVFIVWATLVFHPPSDPEQQIAFLKNLAILGGLLSIVTHGSGKLSLDAMLSKKKAA